MDFDIAFSYEALARAYAVGAEDELAKENYILAVAAGEGIKDPEDRKVFDSELKADVFKKFEV